MKTGTINGSFDLLHDGHKFSIEQALTQVQKLTLLLNSDNSIKLYKGKSRPIQKYQLRKKTLLKYFPQLEILQLNELTPINMLDKIKPDYHFVSHDWGRNPVEKFTVENNGGKLIYIKNLEGFSTTAILKQKKIELDKSEKAIFFDRDGTINFDSGYISSLDEINYLHNSLKGMKLMSTLNYKNIIISNQSGLARGYFDSKQLYKINNKIKNDIYESGGRIDYIYCDTSHPNDNSLTRKPNNGFLVKAAKKFNLSLKNCWMIGDKFSDIYAGRSSNCRAILIKSDCKDKPIRGVSPDFVVNDLVEAYEIILKHS